MLTERTGAKVSIFHFRFPLHSETNALFRGAPGGKAANRVISDGHVTDAIPSENRSFRELLLLDVTLESVRH